MPPEFRRVSIVLFTMALLMHTGNLSCVRLRHSRASRCCTRAVSGEEANVSSDQPSEAKPRATKTLSLLGSMLGDEDASKPSSRNLDGDLVPWWSIKPKQSAPPRQSLSSNKQGRFIMNEEILGELRTSVATELGEDVQMPRSTPVASWATAALALIIFGTYSNISALQGDESSLEFIQGLLLNHGQVLESGEVWRLLVAPLAHATPLQLVASIWGLATVATEAEALLGTSVYLAIFVLSGMAGEAAALASDPAGLSCGPASALAGLSAALFVQQRSVNAALTAAHTLQADPDTWHRDITQALAGDDASDASTTPSPRMSTTATPKAGNTGGQLLLAFHAVGCLSLAALAPQLQDAQLPLLPQVSPVSVLVGALIGGALAVCTGPSYQVSRELDIPIGSMAIPQNAQELVVVVDTRSTVQRVLVLSAAAVLLWVTVSAIAPGA